MKGNEVYYVIFIAFIMLQMILIIYLWLSKNYSNIYAKTDTIIAKLASKHDLTVRQSEIIKFIIDGSKNKEIGQKLFIAENTVKKHRQELYKKLNVKNVAELIKLIRDLEA